MLAKTPTFAKAPIIEAVLDIDCALRPDLDIAALEARARDLFGAQYPQSAKQYAHEFEFESNADAVSRLSAGKALQALQFRQEDGKQLVQVRPGGFSFNRLEPYTSLDDYLPEIKRAWSLFVQLVAPLETKTIRLRYINRILLPMVAGKVDLDEYLTVSPRLANDPTMQLAGFLIQYSAVESGTNHNVNLVLTTQDIESDKLPVILDITVAAPLRVGPNDWRLISQVLGMLRNLKNRLFINSVSTACQKLFQ